MKNAIDWNNEGIERYNQGDFENALHFFEQAIQLDDRNPRFWKNMGDCYYNLNQKSQGFAHYEKAIKLDQDQTPNFYLDYAILHYLEKDPNSALKWILKADQHPKFPLEDRGDLFNWMMDIYIAVNEFNQALRIYNRKNKLPNQSQKTSNDYLRNAKIYTGLQQFERSVTELREGWHQYLGNAAIFTKIFDLFEYFHLYGTLQEWISTGKPYFENQIEFQIKIVIMQINYKDMFGAKKTIENALKLTQDADYLAVLNDAQSKVDQNLEIMHNVLESKESLPDIILEQGIYFFFSRKYKVSLEKISEYLKHNNGSRAGVFLAGILEIFIGKYPNALKIMNLYSEADLEWSIAELGKAYCYFRLEDFETMEIQWKNVVAQKPIFRELLPPLQYFNSPIFLEDFFGLTLYCIKEMGQKEPKK